MRQVWPREHGLLFKRVAFQREATAQSFGSPMLFDRPFVVLPANTRGRDFCIGDLHGCLTMLMRLLEHVGFEPTRDRLFSVGDIVHRGPSSVECLKLAEEPWFCAVMGNHEAKQLGAYNGEFFNGRSVSSMCEYDGADDPLRPGSPDQPQMERILRRLPLAMEFPLPDGQRVGIVHAGLPDVWTWTDIRAMGHRDDFLYDRLGGMQKRILWDHMPLIAAAIASMPDAEQDLHTLYPAATRYQYSLVTKPVAGLDLLVSGHTTLRGKPLTIGNRLYLDTGAGYLDGRLTLVELGTEHYWEVPDPRTEPEMPVTERTGFQQANPNLPWLTPTELATMERTRRSPPVGTNVRLFFPGMDDT